VILLNDYNLRLLRVNEEGGLLRKEYNLSLNDFNDSGRVIRPMDGSMVALDKVSILKDGEYTRIIKYDYANILLGVAICSCGKQINEESICILLEDNSVFYPALCCDKAIFFEEMNE